MHSLLTHRPEQTIATYVVQAGTLGWMPWTYCTYPNLVSSPPSCNASWIPLILVTKHVITFCKQWPCIKRNGRPNNNKLLTIYQGVHITYFIKSTQLITFCLSLAKTKISQNKAYCSLMNILFTLIYYVTHFLFKFGLVLFLCCKKEFLLKKIENISWFFLWVDLIDKICLARFKKEFATCKVKSFP